uniref:Uncharacterized protein n=1 Tax=Medicago truncatula TaxID=3880 RepID=A2Q4Y3_MEDTR|nr:hypothetical protein MtrDRAFT_AC157893g21v2 [Medicago truncatula]
MGLNVLNNNYNIMARFTTFFFFVGTNVNPRIVLCEA